MRKCEACGKKAPGGRRTCGAAVCASLMLAKAQLREVGKAARDAMDLLPQDTAEWSTLRGALMRAGFDCALLLLVPAALMGGF